MWNNGKRNITLNQEKFIDMGPLSRDSGFRFKVTAWGIIKGSNYLVGS